MVYVFLDSADKCDAALSSGWRVSVIALGAALAFAGSVAVTDHANATTRTGSISAVVSTSTSLVSGTSLTIGTKNSSSNLFFGPVAPSGGTESTAQPTTQESGADDLSAQLANFQTASGYTDIPATVSISGEPFQAFTVSLPTQTTFFRDGVVVNVGNYMHDAGGTPTMDGSGLSVVNIDATANVTPTDSSRSEWDFTSEDTALEIPAEPASGSAEAEAVASESDTGGAPSSEPNPSQQLDVTGLLQGFSTGSPYLEITISYN